MAEDAAPETHGHLGPVQLPESIIFSQRLVDAVFDATGVRVCYRTQEKFGKCDGISITSPTCTFKGLKGRLTEALELVCIYGRATDEKNKFKRGSSSAPPEDPAGNPDGRTKRKTFAYGRDPDRPEYVWLGLRHRELLKPPLSK